MLFFKPYSLLDGQTLADAKQDYASAEKVGPFRLSAKAFYQQDGGYVLREAIQNAVSGWGATHVTGCCAGGIPVPRVVITTAQKKIPVFCEHESTAQKLAALLNGEEI